jgi:3-methyl-2-oxobutanoate hydroxymethyltransferase
MDKVTIPALQQMKRDGEKIVAVVAYDYQMAQIVDRAGVDIVSIGDSVGANIWGQTNPLEVTMDQMVLACQGVRRGVKRALVSCDFPYGPLQESTEEAVRAAIRLVKEGGADLVKLDGAADFPDAIRAIIRAGVPVFGQFGITPQTASRFGGMTAGADMALQIKDQLLEEAKIMEDAGASILDFTNSGPVVGEAAAKAAAIPVIGGLGGGPWLDGRIRVSYAAVGYMAASLDDNADRYADVAKISLDAISAFADDVRGKRQIRGGAFVPPTT